MSVHADLSNLNKVWEVKPLKMLGEDEARKILENVAKQVEPIMHKRRWKVTLLSEFCPSDPSLLGLNIGGGAEIKLRLRKQNRNWDFFPYESILDTMLHELCHNVHGPHDGEFYRLLDEIRAELMEHMAKGTGGSFPGFNTPGRQLGGSQPLSSLTQNALLAAQNRARNAGLMPSGPRRVGGDISIRAALRPGEAAAMAAERRLRDDLWCGSKPGEQGNARSSSSSASHPTGAGGSVVTWQCNACTLINRSTALVCGACETVRGEEKGGKFKNPWSCKFCTMNNHVKVDRCTACGEWRYSSGPLVSGYNPFNT